VIKVESSSRPDGARRGPAAFFDLMQGHARCVSVDFATHKGRVALSELVAKADVVIEASRPRALGQLGIDAESVLDAGGPRVWVSITGYGREIDRVAFGDDAAAAGGLVAWDEEGPCFAADAVADPLSGVAAAAAVEQCLQEGGRWIVDVAMARVAAHAIGADAGNRWEPVEGLTAGRPSISPAPRLARGMGADNVEVAAELGIDLP
jgi:crotonobetainyl-CoA:carnitine CoA-transferase CaiB-like acyl-CoA transferase